jgi:hypothetical protein
VQKQTKVSLKTLIKQGCTVTNLKPNNNHLNGKHYHTTQEGAQVQVRRRVTFITLFNQEGIVHHKYTL